MEYGVLQMAHSLYSVRWNIIKLLVIIVESLIKAGIVRSLVQRQGPARRSLNSHLRMELLSRLSIKLGREPTVVCRGNCSDKHLLDCCY